MYIYTLHTHTHTHTLTAFAPTRGKGWWQHGQSIIYASWQTLWCIEELTHSFKKHHHLTVLPNTTFSTHTVQLCKAMRHREYMYIYQHTSPTKLPSLSLSLSLSLTPNPPHWTSFSTYLSGLAYVYKSTTCIRTESQTTNETHMQTLVQDAVSFIRCPLWWSWEEGWKLCKGTKSVHTVTIHEYTLHTQKDAALEVEITSTEQLHCIKDLSLAHIRWAVTPSILGNSCVLGLDFCHHCSSYLWLGHIP